MVLGTLLPGTTISPATLRQRERKMRTVSRAVVRRCSHPGSVPKFAAEAKPFVLLFWSRDPDGTQHNEGDSLQNLVPGINGDTSKRSLQNADHCLKQLLDW